MDAGDAIFFCVTIGAVGSLLNGFELLRHRRRLEQLEAKTEATATALTLISVGRAPPEKR